MASDQNFVDFVLDQIENAGEVTAKKMFGEYGVYSDGKIFALICDNQLFIKPTEAGRAFIGNVVEAPPYTGAKSSFLIEDKIEDREWLSELVRITVKELPEPKPKKKKKKTSGKD
jgi:TfoX/Sxy family transcriptional regulator of competence genes